MSYVKKMLLKDIIIIHQWNVRLVEFLCWLANEWGRLCLIAYPFNIYNLTFQVLSESQNNANPGRLEFLVMLQFKF